MNSESEHENGGRDHGAGDHGAGDHDAGDHDAGNHDAGDHHAGQTDRDIERVVAEGAVTAMYQPIVDLTSGEVVGYEALARGPQGSALEQPGQLFASARRAGLVAELDWACRAAALRGALDAGLGRDVALFINLDPAGLGSSCPPEMGELYERASTELSVVIEVTERDLDADPGAVISRVADLRQRGFAVALDDVGAEEMSLAFLPLLAPDIIKLDMGLIQDPTRDAFAEVGAAVLADAELRGATILGEGIEDDAHLERARVLGATLGQGWHFGRPAPLPASPTAPKRPFGRGSSALEIAATPWALVEPDRPAIAPKRALQPISRHIEQMAHSASDRPVVLGAFQRSAFFTPATQRRYSSLVDASSLVAALGEGMQSSPAPGVRGASFDASDRLVDEWVALTISPYRAAAVIGKDLGDDGPDSERRFAYVITHDRAIVGAAARSMMQYLAPR